MSTAELWTGEVRGADPDVLLDHGEPTGAADEPGSSGLVRSGSVIYAGTQIGQRLETGHNVVIREGCLIGDDVSIWSNTVVDYSCVIGDGVKIHCNCYIAQYTEIGPGAFLAPGVTIANDLYPGQEDSAEVMSGPWIGAGAQLGVNVTVLPFVRIGEGALVGAGSVVTRDLAPGVVAYGNPAVVHGRVEHLTPIEGRIDSSRAAVGHRFSLHRNGRQPGR